MKRQLLLMLMVCLSGIAAYAQESSCSVSAYVIDTNRSGLNVRSGAGTKFGTVGKIAFSEDGAVVDIIGSAGNGWVKINRADSVESEVLFEGGGLGFWANARHQHNWLQRETSNAIQTAGSKKQRGG